MNANNPHRYHWPTDGQTLLLQAALLNGSRALDAWSAWSARQQGNFQDLDYATFRMLPLLYRNLYALGVTGPFMETFKGVYRKTWYKNQLVYHKMATLLQALHCSGIQTMILKGAALAMLCYADPGLRPMVDFDVLVPIEQINEASRVLAQHGWTPQDPWPAPVTADYLCTLHAHNFWDANRQALDLHWHVLFESCAPGADDDFWVGSVPVTLHGVPSLALNPADQLLHCCAHGSRWSSLPPMRWAADATVLIRRPYAPLDWDRLIDQAQKRHLTLTVLGALLYLAELDVTVPQDVLARLESTPVSRLEHSAYMTKTRYIRILGWWPALWYCYLLHSPLHLGRSRLGTVAAFPRYMQYIWELESLKQVPWVALGKVVRRLARGRAN